MLRGKMATAGLGLLVACAPPPRVVPPATPAPAPVEQPAPAPAPVSSASEKAAPERVVPPASELLRDGFAKRFAERVLPKNRYRPPQPRVVVEHEPGKTRYIVDASQYRILIRADDAALWETPARVTPLTRGPVAPKAAGERVMAAPGLPVERKKEKNGFVLVTADDETIQVRGWLESSALTRVYIPAKFPSNAGLGERWRLEQGSSLLDAPAGKVIGRLLDTASPPTRVTEVKRTAAWYVEVAYQSPTLSVHGFVPKSALSEPGYGGSRSGYASVGRKLAPPREKLTFRAGACLYAAPWGEVVGILRVPLERKVHVESGERAAWRQIDLPEGASVWMTRASATTTAPDGSAKPVSLADGFSCAPPPERER